ncbi:tripartite tricarboxylate transporter substrate binding protein [Achromobacter sp. GG226]|uniref:Bug family tripartite tricarboxylate transporter substrate binding protein n=1 Tax=Verticiella alkaliphila TaxID=2779529 RepID=UPI001C0BD19A|nr:tripartite tricarboxylate transporter substrate binding protein [Verticiella sp. GG226]MBU4610921.1 tripartite tricarboxylate transporter substrate binding protein [Verticiella sp. GG226]
MKYANKIIGAVSLACAVMAPGLASAQQWPGSAPIRLIVPASAGGSLDVLTRPLAQQLSKILDANVIVENRGGAAGMIGADHVAKSPPDGHTFLMGAIHHAIAATVMKNVSFDPKKDLVAVASIGSTPNVLMVTAQAPAKTPDEFVAWIKKESAPNYATGGPGGLHHLSAEQLSRQVGVQAQAVHYRGSAPAMTDLISGQVHFMLETMPAAINQIKAGSTRAIAVTTKERSAVFPDVPTLDESIAKGFDVQTWYGIMAPGGTSPEIVSAMRDAVAKALDTPEMKKVWEASGTSLPSAEQADFQAFWLAEIDRWGKVAKDNNVSID